MLALTPKGFVDRYNNSYSDTHTHPEKMFMEDTTRHTLHPAPTSYLVVYMSEAR